MQKDLLIKNFTIDETKTDEIEGIITGFGACYDNVDRQNDVIERGAFKAWLSNVNQENIKNKLKICYAHKRNDIVGVPLSILNRNEGLEISVKIYPDAKTPNNVKLLDLIKDKTLDSLSIGMIPQESEVRNGIRYISKAEVYEISFVGIPANPKAMIMDVKGFNQRYNAFKEAIGDAGKMRDILQKDFDFTNSEMDLLEAYMHELKYQNKFFESKVEDLSNLFAKDFEIPNTKALLSKWFKNPDTDEVKEKLKNIKKAYELKKSLKILDK